ncbi:MAG: hypothetical protein LC776_11320 [Acidobacteria bacterium]|nr:hypothetical protein [Acidobacteriota bacterium]
MLELAWMCRRLFPLTLGITGAECINYLQGKPPLFYISAPSWLIASGFNYAIWSAVYPYAKRPRRGPLDKWFALAFSVLFILLGIVVASIQMLLATLDLQPGNSILGRMAEWHNNHPLGESLGWTAGVIALGLSIIAATESLPNWRNGLNVIAAKGPPPEWALPGASFRPHQHAFNKQHEADAENEAKDDTNVPPPKHQAKRKSHKKARRQRKHRGSKRRH